MPFRILRRHRVTALGALAVMALMPLAIADADADRARPSKTPAPASNTLLFSTLAGSLTTDPEQFGVKPGTATWLLDRGIVRLTTEGRLKVLVRGLVIPDPPANGTNPVPTLSASVFCGGTLVATTATVPFNSRGNAGLNQRIGGLPSPCATPAVLVHLNAVTARYIAFNGSR